MDEQTRRVVDACTEWFAEKARRPNVARQFVGQTLYWLDPDRWRPDHDGTLYCSAVFAGHAGYACANDATWWFEPDAGATTRPTDKEPA